MKSKVETRAKITCPHCGFQKEEEMPTNACQHLYKCTNCNEMIRSKTGDCCVFCSFADKQCPPKQLESN